MKTHVLLVVVCVAGCSPAAATPALPSGASSSSSAQGTPSEVSSCEIDDDHFGAWTPTIDEIVEASRALPAYCVSSGVRENAIRACAGKLGKTNIKLGVTVNAAEERRCWDSIVPAEHEGRRWIAVHAFFQNGAEFAGSGAAAEIKGGRASRFVENDGLAASCDAASDPKGAGADWRSLPVDLRRFLCGYSSKR